MKQSTKYLLYAAGAYYVLTSGVLVASAAVNRRDQYRHDMDNALGREKARSRRLVQEKQELSAQIIKQDKAFQNYLTYLQRRLNNFPYYLNNHSSGPVRITKGNGDSSVWPFYPHPQLELAQGETHIDRWASDISWTY